MSKHINNRTDIKSIHYFCIILPLQPILGKSVDPIFTFLSQLRSLHLNKLDFLDVTIILNYNSLMFDWFHKPTFSGRYLNYLSQHPICQKKDTIMRLTDRAFLFSHPQFHRKNLKIVINILLDNYYPIDFIFQTTHERFKRLISNSKTKSLVLTVTVMKELSIILRFYLFHPFLNILITSPKMLESDYLSSV